MALKVRVGQGFVYVLSSKAGAEATAMESSSDEASLSGSYLASRSYSRPKVGTSYLDLDHTTVCMTPPRVREV